MTERLVPAVKRWAGQLTPSLLLLLLFGSVVYGLADAVRGIESGFLWPLVWIGLLFGWLLARSAFPAWLCAVLGLLAGMGLMVLHVGDLGNGLVGLVDGWAYAIWQWMQGQTPPDMVAAQTAWAGIIDAAGILVARLYAWGQGFFRGQPSVDPMPIAFLWGAAVWATAVWAGWALQKGTHALLIVAPPSALLAFALAYVGGQALYLLPVLGSALILKALLENERRNQRWQQAGVAHSSRAGPDTVWLAAGLSLALMLAAAFVPSISMVRIAELAGDLRQDGAVEKEIARSLGLESRLEAVPAALSILDARRASGLPTRHLIGSGPELSELVAMIVSIESEPAAAQLDAGEQAAPIYYWRSLTYDGYSDRGWSAEYAGRVRYAAGETALAASTPYQHLLRQKVRRVRDTSGLLYVAGGLVTADREFRVAWRSLPDEEVPVDAYGALIEADTYRADSLITVVGEADLRASEQDYPAWIVERYLALPDSVPDRVLALARDLTVTALTPYDRALAIEAHLRQFPYTLDLPSPPADRDVADYFLFDLQKGYCDYYASAMVVLARAAGLPARLVTGYASGTYDEKEAHFTVTEADAHAWPEIYFQGYGWIEFEPTAGRMAIERPEAAASRPAPRSEALPKPITVDRIRLNWARWLEGVAALLLLTALGLGGWLLADDWRLGRLPPETAVASIFRRLYRYGAPLGVRIREGDTPQEFAAAFRARMVILANGRRWGWLLISARGEIDWLATLCNRALYSPHPPQALDRARAIQAWQRLRPRLWLAGLLA